MTTQSAKERVYRAAMKWFNEWPVKPSINNGWCKADGKLWEACAAAKKGKKK